MTVVEPGSAFALDPQRWPDLGQVPPAGVTARLARRIFAQAVAHLPVRVLGPGGRRLGGGGDERSATMTLHRPHEFFARVGAHGLIGFGESYQTGAWDADDLAAVLGAFARRVADLVPRPLQKLRGLYVARLPSEEDGDPVNARRNIERHYDLSNDLFELFLDESMTYSSALYGGAPAGGDESDDEARALHRAQLRKIDSILDAAGVREGSNVLEIGSGWGALAMRAAGERGAHVTTLTLSKEQKALAQERIAAAGLGERIEVRLADYREVGPPRGAPGYDAIVSVEMIEAVGERYWPDYFESIDRLLAPGGRAAVQSITMSHQRMLATRRTYTWIHKYIFPGGLIPSVPAIEQALRARTRLRLVRRLDFGEDYARTLRTWRNRFEAHWPAVSALGFDEVFHRTWRFYLAYCEAGFATGYLGVSQLTFAR
nr:cyclopropane-fatty-acyl-phospholipid synthase family protein [Actinocrinis puniceicyclus]